MEDSLALIVRGIPVVLEETLATFEGLGGFLSY
jgi:hypothetical protein